MSLKIEEISILEDSRHFVNRAVEALNLQMNRLEKYTFEDAGEFWEYLADSHFYIVALKRLRQSFFVSKKNQRVWVKFEKEFNAFDQDISDAIKMRHVLEHVDDYIKNSGKDNAIKNSNLYTNHFDENGCLNWAGLKFDRHKLQESAEKVVKKYREITSHEFGLYREKL